MATISLNLIGLYSLLEKKFSSILILSSILLFSFIFTPKLNFLAIDSIPYIALFIAFFCTSPYFLLYKKTPWHPECFSFIYQLRLSTTESTINNVASILVDLTIIPSAERPLFLLQ